MSCSNIKSSQARESAVKSKPGTRDPNGDTVKQKSGSTVKTFTSKPSPAQNTTGL